MPKISDAQIAGYASAAGVSGENVAIAVAVAIAESGGNTEAHNPVGLDNSYGLWQINMLGSMGPERRSKLGIANNEALFDPAVNARAMVMISSGGVDWKPWTTFTRGTYLMYMGRGNKAAGNPDSSGIVAALTGDSVDPLTATTNLAQRLQDPAFWKRSGVGALGVAVALVGAYFVLSKEGTKVVRKVESVL